MLESSLFAPVFPLINPLTCTHLSSMSFFLSFSSRATSLTTLAALSHMVTTSCPAVTSSPPTFTSLVTGYRSSLVSPR